MTDTYVIKTRVVPRDYNHDLSTTDILLHARVRHDGMFMFLMRVRTLWVKLSAFRLNALRKIGIQSSPYASDKGGFSGALFQTRPTFFDVYLHQCIFQTFYRASYWTLLIKF